MVHLYILCLLTICNTRTYFINLSSVKHQIINIIVWQCDPVNSCHDEFGIKKFLTMINIMMVINFVIMVVSLH